MGIDQPQLTIGREGPLLDAHNALLARLTYAFPAKQFPLYIVPARISKATWARIAERAPFVAVGFAGLRPTGSGRLYQARASWTVFVGGRQERPANLLVGDARGAGLLGMMGVAVAVLHSQTDKGVGTWQCGEASNLYDEQWANDELGVLAVEVGMELQVTDPSAAAALPNFDELAAGLSWDLPDLDEPINPLYTRAKA
jgi:hypothetical protein